MLAESGALKYKGDMEVTGIDKVQTLGKIVRKEAIAAARIEDKLTISAESQKRAEWVEMLKSMPDVRPERIDAALRSDAWLNPAKVLADVAHHLLNS